MEKIRYLARHFMSMNFDALRENILFVSGRIKKSRIVVAIDMLICSLRYLAAPSDYVLFQFYRLKHAERKTYITRGVNNRLVKKHNPKDFWNFFDNKDEFNELFSEYIKREWLRCDKMSRAEFAAFIEKYPVFFFKPLDECCGRGIEKIAASASCKQDALFKILSKKRGIIEEPIRQHAELAELCPTSINSIRLVTMRGEKDIEVMFAFLRVGNGSHVDNLNAGGMAAPIDIESGYITHAAANRKEEVFVIHPQTRKKIKGIQIPRFEETLALVKKAANCVPVVEYVAWDVAITPQGPCLIEGNCYPGYDILQLPAHLEDGKGMLRRIEVYL